MAKQTKRTRSSATFKNPLAQAFGETLKRQRKNSGKTSEEIADTIGIGRSYYRLVESGTNHLHISKAVNLVTAFQEVIKLDAVVKIFMSISYMEVTANKFIHDKISFNT